LLTVSISQPVFHIFTGDTWLPLTEPSSAKLRLKSSGLDI